MCEAKKEKGREDIDSIFVKVVVLLIHFQSLIGASKYPV
jgi:hypothetical protein